ncbi:MAG: hypothetical protein WBP81_20725 [Solirubrobacteraceae bacterium]
MLKTYTFMRHNAIGLLALFIALGGTSYAAFVLPAGSVGTPQLRNHSVTPIKLDRNSIGGYVRFVGACKCFREADCFRPSCQGSRLVQASVAVLRRPAPLG